MSSQAPHPRLGPAAQRLPHEPYPGLRPFLDFEAPLFFGRERQVSEIVEHLARTQFVAVLGGSGSGKSSLIRAGVIPYLRSYGIALAGDCWLPLVSIPGTNVGAQDQAAGRYTPIARLAQRFAHMLKPLPGPFADEAAQGAAHGARVAAIAQVLRQEGGLARLMHAYGSELQVPPGPKPEQARVLFLIDQFEELFHPTNEGVSDVNMLVERVLDHFFAPHPRCYVVITMRSEHLNDCAKYLELPDAINKSAYLVRRLGQAELRQAIEGPAQRFLRLVARARTSRVWAKAEATVLAPAAEPTAAAAQLVAALPEQVQFEPEVVQRLVRDVAAITHDSDHLPLLQHLLARLWQAACEREGQVVPERFDGNPPVPAAITWADLIAAVAQPFNAGAALVALAGEGAWPPGQGSHVSANHGALSDGVNTLRASAANWPERLFQALSEGERQGLSTVLARMAYKDPNTGLYLQQRIVLDEAAALFTAQQAQTPEAAAQASAARQGLHALLRRGFLGSVDYLFWDDDDPGHATLKVSHEAFIRGWPRFRQIVDQQAQHYAEFASVVRRCAQWQQNDQARDYLLEGGELRRLQGGGLNGRLQDASLRPGWLQLLALERDGPALLAAEPLCTGFWAHSMYSSRRRAVMRWIAPVVMALALLAALGLTFVFTSLIQTPTLSRAEVMLSALNQARMASAGAAQPSVAQARQVLNQTMRAAADLEAARSGEASRFGRISRWLIEQLQALPFVRSQGEFLERVAAQSEPVVNERLRAALSGTLWPLPGQPGGQALSARGLEASCSVPDTAGAAPVPGRLWLAAPSQEVGKAGAAPEVPPPTLPRALFVPSMPPSIAASSDLVAYAAVWDEATRTCHAGAVAVLWPASLGAHVALDATLQTLVSAVQSSSDDAPTVIVQRLQWANEATVLAGGMLARETLASVGDVNIVNQVRTASTGASSGGMAKAPDGPLGTRGLVVVPTWQEPAGLSLQLGQSWWRLLNAQVQPVHALAAQTLQTGTQRLARSAPGGACFSLKDQVALPGWRTAVLELAPWCLVVHRTRLEKGSEAEVSAGAVPRNQEWDQIRLTVYQRPEQETRQAQGAFAPAASLEPSVPAAPAAVALAASSAVLAGGAGTASNGGVVNRAVAVLALAPYAHVPANVGDSLLWAYGREGPYAGWILLGTPSAEAGAAAIGLPLSTCALWRLGQGVALGSGYAALPAEPGATAKAVATQAALHPPARPLQCGHEQAP